MTPKEKAVEIYHKMLREVKINMQYWSELTVEINALNCALICVDEIIEAIDFDWMEVQNLEAQHRYWEQVKQEINQLICN
jgi:hypothetical protein